MRNDQLEAIERRQQGVANRGTGGMGSKTDAAKRDAARKQLAMNLRKSSSETGNATDWATVGSGSAAGDDSILRCLQFAVSQDSSAAQLPTAKKLRHFRNRH